MPLKAYRVLNLLSRRRILEGKPTIMVLEKYSKAVREKRVLAGNEPEVGGGRNGRLDIQNDRG
jgi:hypothetical protein